MTQQTAVAASDVYLYHLGWTLRIAPSDAQQFQLWRDQTLMFSGRLEILKNRQELSCEMVNWQFRTKTDRLEQWGQLHDGETLSLNMNYRFTDEALVIEYLARNAVPIRLDVRHHINASEQAEHSFSATVTDQTARDNPPHSTEIWGNMPQPKRVPPSLSHNQPFNEAFSAKQWIVLSKQ
ncbi:hypothetical protein [Vibrio sp.]|uniref:hypothetical protein n=1 Tax=Vibrio sp. TaxID=678 RepID=UPI003D1426B4